VDPFDKPWLKLAAKTPAKPTAQKGRVTSARIRGSWLTVILAELSKCSETFVVLITLIALNDCVCSCLRRHLL